MSQYPPETMRALDREVEKMDQADRMFAMHRELYLDAVTSGADIQLLSPYALTRTQWPISDYLCEPGKEGKALLFQACTAAMRGDADAADKLRLFVDLQASEYAQDAIDVWGAE